MKNKLEILFEFFLNIYTFSDIFKKLFPKLK